MGRRSAAAVLALSGGVLVLAGCGSGSGAAADPGGALDVSLEGFHPAAQPPVTPTLCDPDPADPAVPAPGLPDLPGSPDGAFLESASTTLEARAWAADDADAARALVAEADAAAADCTWSVATDHDLDGDGVAETAGTDAQQAAGWSAGDWSGVRVVRTVSGQEQVDRRLVARGDVVLLVVVRADGDDPGLLTAADDYLDAVARRMR